MTFRWTEYLLLHYSCCEGPRQVSSRCCSMLTSLLSWWTYCP